MNAVLLSIGDELTSGQTVDTNSAWLARQLAGLGIRVLRHATVADRQGDICNTLRDSAAMADLVLVTGGLGPTADDLTRQALAEALGRELVTDEDSLKQIEEFFARRNRKMNPGNAIQAMLPAGAKVLANPIGTAPGIAARLGQADIYLMPGVPREMRKMFSEQILPRLDAENSVILFSTVHLAGMGESDVGATIEDLMVREGDVVVGTTASGGMVSARITVRAASAEQARTLTERTVCEIRRRLGDHVFGQDQTTLAGAVGELLQQKAQTLATAESCTGGLIGKLLTDVPGSSAHYRGTVVAYENDVKSSLLEVGEQILREHGAVSGPVARAMAQGARKRIGADWAISTTGIAGPSGGSDQKPVGLVYIGIAGPEGCEVFKRHYPGDRETMRLRTALGALNELRMQLLSRGPESRRED